ncbi:hypothetical protein CLAIMM_12298 isoform 1, partial [Cladophialophora immunda]
CDIVFEAVIGHIQHGPTLPNQLPLLYSACVHRRFGNLAKNKGYQISKSLNPCPVRCDVCRPSLSRTLPPVQHHLLLSEVSTNPTCHTTRIPAMADISFHPPSRLTNRTDNLRAPSAS